MIHIVDYGCGNLASIANMLTKIRVPSRIVSAPGELAVATKIILPGVGTFDSGMRGIREHGLRSVLDRKALEEKVPVLGICLGAQLMTSGSDEGAEPGLSWLTARTVRFDFAAAGVKALPLPNIGWRDVAFPNGEADMSASHDEGRMRFYFVHKYHFAAESQLVWMRSTYGYSFASALRRHNLYSVQFHPEKSHRFGKQLLSWFSALPSGAKR